MTKQLKLSALIVALIASTSAFATKPGYAVDRDTDSVVRNNYGECWKTNYFNQATDGLVECGDAATAIVAPEEKLVNERLSLSANFLFGFDKSTLRPEASTALDPIAARLAGAASVQLEKVTVEGHTDFIGTDKYNNALSQRRAHAVRNYLVAKGVDAQKIHAVGLGKSQTKMTATCKAETAKIKNAARKRQALIACIEPDRRVDIDVRVNVERLVK